MLERIFDMDNPLMRALSVAADLILLNLLTVFCSIPVFTWGASYTALNDLVGHLVRGEEGYVAKSFFQSFRTNFKKGVLLGLLFLVAGGVLAVDIYALRKAMFAVRIFFYVLAMWLLLLAILSFALLSRYENSIVVTLKNAVSLVVGFFPYCLGILCTTMVFLGILFVFWSRLLPVVLLMGVSLPCYVNALFFVRIFDRLEERNTTEESA